MVASTLSPDTVELPGQLLANLTVVELGMLCFDSSDCEGSEGVTHLASKQQLSDAGHPAMDGGEDLKGFQ
jgi:hypothetical protein